MDEKSVAGKTTEEGEEKKRKEGEGEKEKKSGKRLATEEAASGERQ